MSTNTAKHLLFLSFLSIILLFGAHTALAQTAAPASPAATTATAPAQAPAPATASNFVPLTNLPGIKEVPASGDLSGFLNIIYKIAIGVAASLAVLQIIHAGILYMGGDSVTETKQARSLIGNALLGLVLVLSPYIVFGIINHNILGLKIGFGGLATGAAPFAGPQNNLFSDTSSSFPNANAHCDQVNGTATFQCISTGNPPTTRTVGVGDSCGANETPNTVCASAADAVNTNNSCSAQYASIKAYPVGIICDSQKGYEAIPTGCCSGITPGGICCGRVPDGSPGALGAACYPDNTCSAGFLCTSGTCTFDPTTAGKGTSVDITEFIYRPTTGNPQDLGALPTDKATSDDFRAVCVENHGTITLSYGGATVCPAAAGADAAFPSMAGYVKCAAVNVSCK